MSSRPKRVRVASAGAVAAAASAAAHHDASDEDEGSRAADTEMQTGGLEGDSSSESEAPPKKRGKKSPATTPTPKAKRPVKKRRGVGLGLGATVSARAMDEAAAAVGGPPPPSPRPAAPAAATAALPPAAATSTQQQLQTYTQFLQQQQQQASAPWVATPATSAAAAAAAASASAMAHQAATATASAAQFTSPFTVSATAIAAAAAHASRANMQPADLEPMLAAARAHALRSAAAGLHAYPYPPGAPPPSSLPAYPPISQSLSHSQPPPSSSSGGGDSTMFQLQSHTGVTHLTPLQQSQLLGEQSDAKKKQTAASSAKVYNRKDKSLGLLCENFLKMYSSGVAKDICLDGAATSLGVERRRIYDIVNILESVDIVSRRGKNQYIWHGTTRLAAAIRQLEHAIVSTGLGFQQVDLMGVGQLNAFQQPAGQHQLNMQPPSTQITFGHTGPAYDDEDDGGRKKKKKAAPDSRKEQSLGHLSQVFVQMFLSNDTRIVSLDDAGKWLLGGPVVRPGETEAKAQANFKSRVRRLYDIANVFNSLELIEKIHLVQTRKPAFKWLGARVYPLVSSVSREAYTPDAPMRRPTNRPGFDAVFPMQPNLLFTPTATMATAGMSPNGMPPPVPRRATIDTAQLASAQASASSNDLNLTSTLRATPVPAHNVPNSLLSLHASFEQFEAIKTERGKRSAFDVDASNSHATQLPGSATKMKKEERTPPSSASKVEAPSRSGSFARPLVPTRSPSTVAAHHTTMLNLGASAHLPPSFDPLLLAYARPPPTTPHAAISVPATSSTAEATSALSARAGFPLESTAYVRDSSDFLSRYRSACSAWQKKMPTLKHMFLKHVMAPTQPALVK